MKGMKFMATCIVLSSVLAACDLLLPKSDSKEIVTFYFADTTSTQTFYDDLRVIEIVVPYNTEITGLTPMIQHTGASIVPASGEVQNFTSSRKYAVTAENGTTQVYTVEVEIAPITPTLLSDTRFIGDFVFFYYWEDAWGIEEDSEYTSYDFDGTNKVFYYTSYQSYSTSWGWTYSGDYIGDSYSWYLEFDISNGNYRERLWDNSFSEWSEWESYSFSSDGSILTLNNYYNIEGNDKVLEKSNSRSVYERRSITGKSEHVFSDYLNDIEHQYVD